LGKIISKMTDKHTIESRTEIILKENNIKNDIFYDLIYEEIPSNDWQIPQEEYEYRSDLRKECIFTIDPPTAKDLDDALSCKKIDDDTYEIGIHIADVPILLNLVVIWMKKLLIEVHPPIWFKKLFLCFHVNYLKTYVV